MRAQAPHGPATRLRQTLVDLEPPQTGQLLGTAAVSEARAHRCTLARVPACLML
jgi:hypothetical protein